MFSLRQREVYTTAIKKKGYYFVMFLNKYTCGFSCGVGCCIGPGVALEALCRTTGRSGNHGTAGQTASRLGCSELFSEPLDVVHIVANFSGQHVIRTPNKHCERGMDYITHILTRV